MGFARSNARRAALLLAGTLAGACVFPEYDVKDAAGASGSGGSALGGVSGSRGGSEAAGTSPDIGGNGGASGTAGSAGSAATSGASQGGSIASDGGAAGRDTGAAGTDAMGGGAGEGMTGSGGCSPVDCPASTCNNGTKDGTEAAVDCGDSAGECGDCSFAIDKHVIGSGGVFSGSATVTWDATGITFDFSVVDATPKNDSSEPWNDDAVEVFLDLNHGKTTSYESNDFQIIVPRDESATHSPQGGANTGAMPVERSSNSAGYKVKITIPWSTIGASGDPPLGKTIGFDLAIDDDSDGGDRNAQVVTFGTAENFFDTSQFGEITLN